MKITVKCPHVKQQFPIGGGHELFCQRNGKIVTISNCFKCKADAKLKGATK